MNEIYLTYLKRKPTLLDIEAHIKKNKDEFIVEVLNCVEYKKLLNIYNPNLDSSNKIETVSYIPNLDLLNKINKIKFSSGYGNIFMHNSKLFLINDSNIYENIGLSSPSYYENNWHSILALTHDNKVVTNSNTFYWENWESLGTKWIIQNEHNKIFDRIVYTYHHIKNAPIKKRQTIDDECFLLANPFTSTNAGHELSIILDCVVYIRKHNIQKIILFKYAYKYPNNLDLLKLLIPECKFIFIDFDIVYQFKKIHIIKQELHNIFKHQPIIDELKTKIIAKYNLPKFKNKKVIMIKNNRNKQVLRTYDQFICENLFTELQKRNYVIINPEEMNIFDITLYLLFAKVIISSYGGILYTHQIFFNTKADIYILCFKGTIITSYYKIIANTKEVIPLADRNLDMKPDLTKYLLMKFL